MPRQPISTNSIANVTHMFVIKKPMPSAMTQAVAYRTVSIRMPPSLSASAPPMGRSREPATMNSAVERPTVALGKSYWSTKNLFMKYDRPTKPPKVTKYSRQKRQASTWARTAPKSPSVAGLALEGGSFAMTAKTTRTMATGIISRPRTVCQP